MIARKTLRFITIRQPSLPTHKRTTGRLDLSNLYVIFSTTFECRALPLSIFVALHLLWTVFSGMLVTVQHRAVQYITT